MFCFCCFFFSFLFDVLRDITNWFLFKNRTFSCVTFPRSSCDPHQGRIYVYTSLPWQNLHLSYCNRERSVMTYLAFYANKLIPQSILSLNDYIILLLKFQLTWWCFHYSNLVEDAVGYCQLRLWGWGNCEFWTQGGVRFSTVSNRHTRNNFVSRQGR